MKYIIPKLEWQDFRTLDNDIKITELDKFADISFDNGNSARISTGQMAHTNIAFPYELNILYANGNRDMIPKLNLSDLNLWLNNLDNGKF
jgi:hypothetical protein